MTNILIPFYSSFGHVYKLAKAVQEGSQSLPDTEVRLRLFPEIELLKKDNDDAGGRDFYRQARAEMGDIPDATLDDLRWADGVVWGTPTRYGNMCAQMKQFIDLTGQIWREGALEGKPTGVFTSTGTIHGGQETTIIASLIPLLHLGMIFVGTPYTENPPLFKHEPIGGSPYGPSTLAARDLLRKPVEDELSVARNLGVRVAAVADRLKSMRSRQ